MRSIVSYIRLASGRQLRKRTNRLLLSITKRTERILRRINEYCPLNAAFNQETPDNNKKVKKRKKERKKERQTDRPTKCVCDVNANQPKPWRRNATLSFKLCYKFVWRFCCMFRCCCKWKGGGFFGIGAQRSKSNVQSDQWLFCTTCQNMTLTESDGWINNLMLERITLNWYVRHQQKV